MFPSFVNQNVQANPLTPDVILILFIVSMCAARYGQ
jgi:hypothetical protein